MFDQTGYIIKLRRKNRLYEATLFIIGVLLLIASRLIVADYEKLSVCMSLNYQYKSYLERATNVPPNAPNPIEYQLLPVPLKNN